MTDSPPRDRLVGEQQLWNTGGWHVRSALAITGATVSATDTEPDITVSIAAPSAIAIRPGPVWACAADGAVRLSLPGLAALTMRAGTSVALEPAFGAAPTTLGLLLAGPALAVLQRQRGLLPLDGAALAWRGGALLIVGPSGQGKSSLAAALAQRGWPVLADGVLAVDAAAGRLTCGAARLRLWARPAAALGIDLGNACPVRPGEARSDLDWPSGVGSGPWPIKGLVLITERSAVPRCPTVSSGTAAAWLARSVWARPAYVDDKALLADAIALAVPLPCWQLAPAQGVERLAETAEVIIAALGQSAPMDDGRRGGPTGR